MMDALIALQFISRQIRMFDSEALMFTNSKQTEKYTHHYYAARAVPAPKMPQFVRKSFAIKWK